MQIIAFHAPVRCIPNNCRSPLLRRLLRNMTNNLNQISKRLNGHGQMDETEIEEVQQKQNELWVMMRQLLSLLDRSE